MKILIVSPYGSSAPLAYRLSQEGHKVQMWIKEPSEKDVMKGFVERIDDWNLWTELSDLIIFDFTGFGKEAEELRKLGKSVIGGTEYSDKIELDRGFGQKEMESIGLDILPTEKFTNIEKAKQYVVNNPGRYVIKPDGKGQDEKALTYVGQDENGIDVVAQLDHYQKNFSKGISSVEIQQYVDGVEVGASAFFNGKDFVEPIQIDFEHKKLMNGNIGPNTGEMGTTLFWTDMSNRLFKEMLYPIRDRLQGYHGYIDINCIMKEENLYPLEYTCRFGYPTIQLKMQVIKNNFGEWLKGLADGKDTSLEVEYPYCACIVIGVPPFPYEDKKTFEKYSKDSLVIINSEDKEGYWPSALRKENDEWLVAGTCGEALTVIGAGDSMEEAISNAYERVSKVIISNMMYRTDIGSKWDSDSRELMKYGWI